MSETPAQEAVTVEALSAWPLTTWQVYELDVYLGELTITPGAYRYAVRGGDSPSAYLRERFPFFDTPVGTLTFDVAENGLEVAKEERGTLFTSRFEGSEEVFLIRHQSRKRLYFHASFSEYQTWTIETERP